MFALRGGTERFVIGVPGRYVLIAVWRTGSELLLPRNRNFVFMLISRKPGNRRQIWSEMPPSIPGS